MWRYMARVCIRHPFLVSENLCGRCGSEFCRECLVFPRGQKLPLCVTCAVTASGARVRGAAGISKRIIRSRSKERARETAEREAAAASPIETAPTAKPTVTSNPENDMMSWLDTVYSTDRQSTDRTTS